ncbi:hypothetical protein ABT354_13355 [Streptomyces sp. NPDC000594]|uniref:hypothetical protein n=1 Tax=Streptomyces sp. NPDC000594 TaxID=3154261 RepID=UPI003326E79D
MTRRTMRVGVLAAVVLPLSLACSPAEPRQSDKASPAAKPAASSAAPARTVHTGPLRSPELDGSATLAGRQNEIRGGATFEFDKGRKGHALIVTARCQGKGALRITVEPLDSQFTLKCLDGEVSSMHNELTLGGAEKAGIISVRAPSSVRWSMAVGRDVPAVPEGPGGSETTGTSGAR